MNSKVYQVILVLITTSLLGLIGIQFYWLKNQYSIKKQDLVQDGKEAIREMDRYIRNSINSQANINGDQLDNIDLYYESPDSTLEIIFQGVTRKRNTDGSSHEMDHSVMDVRLRQFQNYIEDMELSKPHTDPTLGENYLILYGQKDLSISSEKNWIKLNKNFRLDSVLTTILESKGVNASFHYGIYNNEAENWEYNSNGDSSGLLQSDIHEKFYDEELVLYIEFLKPNQQVIKSMTLPLILSALLIITILGSLFFMYYVIMKQKKVSEIKNDFINNMTHEFKTPLATIALAAANIENPAFIQDETMIRKFTKVIKLENKKLNQKVEQVLGAAISDNSRWDLNLEPVDMHELIQDIMPSISMKFSGNKYQLDTYLDAAKSMVLGDRLHLEHMVSNLLDNAFKYSPKGGRIIIKTTNADGELNIQITDHGLGIKNDNLNKIFDKFYRIPTGDLHNIKGFGLGLNYTMAIAIQHKGSLVVESKFGEGSAFTIKLPIKPES